MIKSKNSDKSEVTIFECEDSFTVHSSKEIIKSILQRCKYLSALLYENELASKFNRLEGYLYNYLNCQDICKSLLSNSLESKADLDRYYLILNSLLTHQETLNEQTTNPT